MRERLLNESLFQTTHQGSMNLGQEATIIVSQKNCSYKTVDLECLYYTYDKNLLEMTVLQ